MHWVCVQGEKKTSSHYRATDLNFNLQTVASQATTQTSFQLQFPPQQTPLTLGQDRPVSSINSWSWTNPLIS